MPCEFRIIRFRLDEVSAAVQSFAPRISLTVPDTNILSAHAAPDSTPNVLLRYGEEEASVVLSNNRLAASLIAYCQILGIPLPREGQKSIQVSKDNVDLRMSSMDLGVEPATERLAEGLNLVTEAQTPVSQTETVATVQID